MSGDQVREGERERGRERGWERGLERRQLSEAPEITLPPRSLCLPLRIEGWRRRRRRGGRDEERKKRLCYLP